MLRGFRWFGRVMAAIGALLLLYGLWRLGDTGGFDPFPEASAGVCNAVETAVTVSDAVLDEELGIAYLAGFDAAAERAGEPVRGALYVLDLRAAAPLLLRMTAGSLEDLRPAGLGLYRDPTGLRTLFVIDRHPGAERVKIFDVSGTRASHRETVSDPAFRALNDIVPTGPRQFYATNDSRAEASLLRPLEAALGLPTASIVYFDGTLADPVAKGLVAARGLALSPDGKELYVAEGLAHRVRVYRRAENGILSEARRLPLRGIPDKLATDAAGQIWLTGQFRLFRLFLHRLDTRFAAPTQVLRLDPANGAAAVIHADDGHVIADARVALYAEGALLMAARSMPVLMLCRSGAHSAPLPERDEECAVGAVCEASEEPPDL